MDIIIEQLRNVIATSPHASLPHRFATTKMDAVLGKVPEASASLRALLKEFGDKLPDDEFIFINVLHIALLTDQLDTASEAINRRFRAGDWFRISYEIRKPELLTVVSWRVTPARSTFVVSNELRSSPRFDFVINRLASILPLCAAYRESGESDTGEIQVNLEDHGVLPGLAFCESRPDYFLVPDPPYLRSRAYEGMRKHYSEHPVAWHERKPVAFWRGSTTGRIPDPVLGWRSLPRVRLCEIARAHSDIMDAGISEVVQLPSAEARKQALESGLLAKFVPPTEFPRFRYQIDIDGNSNSWPGLFQKLLTGSPVLKVASAAGYRQWYYDRLVPWVNYVPVREDMSDLVEKIEWLKAHDEDARKIGERGRLLAEELDYRTEVQRAVGTIAAAIRYAGRFPEVAVRFGAGEGGNKWLRHGWSEPEAGGVAALGYHAQIELPRPVTNDDFAIAFELTPATVPPLQAHQRIVLVANGEILTQADLKSRGTLRCLLPRPTIQKSESLCLDLLFPDAHRAASELRPGDGRIISATLHQLALFPARPLGGAQHAASLVAANSHVPLRYGAYELYALNGAMSLDLRNSIVTSHGSILFVNVAAGTVAHGSPDLAPRNLYFLEHHGRGHLIYEGVDRRRFYVRILPSNGTAETTPVGAGFELTKEGAPVDSFGLQRDGLFLCSEQNGRVTLSRQKLGPWESFSLMDIRAQPPTARPSHHIRSVKRQRVLPVTFFTEAKIDLSSDGVPTVKGAPLDVTGGVGNAVIDEGGLNIVIRDPQYISHYFHFLEMLIGAFAFHMQHLPGRQAIRLFLGAQSWDNARQNSVQRHLLNAVYGGIEIIGTEPAPYDARWKNVLLIDRNAAATRINKFLEQLLPEARLWVPELRRRAWAYAQVSLRPRPADAAAVRCAYISRVPPRTLTAEARARLFAILSDRFGSVEEVDFATMSWREQVAYCARTDLLVGLHGNGLTNLLWQQPHSVAIELFQRGFHAYDYQMMAEMVGIDYFGFEATEGGQVYRNWCRVGPPGGDINQPVDELPEAALNQALDLVEAQLVASL